MYHRRLISKLSILEGRLARSILYPSPTSRQQVAYVHTKRPTNNLSNFHNQSRGLRKIGLVKVVSYHLMS